MSAYEGSIGLQNSPMKNLYNPGGSGNPDGERRDLGSVHMDAGPGKGLFGSVQGMRPSGAPGGPQPGGDKPSPMQNTARFMGKLRKAYDWAPKLGIAGFYG